MAVRTASRSEPSQHISLNVNELQLVCRRPAQQFRYPGINPPPGLLVWEATSSITDCGELPKSFKHLSRKSPGTFEITIGGKLTQHGVTSDPEMEHGLEHLDAKVLSHEIAKRFSDAGVTFNERKALLAMHDEFMPRQWQSLEQSGIPKRYIDAIKDVLAMVVRDYFGSTWARDDTSLRHHHNLYGTIIRKKVSLPTEEEKASPYYDGVPHIDFFGNSHARAVGYQFADNNPTKYLVGTFRYMGHTVRQYTPPVVMLDQKLESVGDVNGAGRLYRTDDIRALVHNSDIVEEGYRTLGRFFIGPDLATAIVVRETINHILTVEFSNYVSSQTQK